VTPVIDSYHAVLSVLGERFMLLRVLQANRQATAEQALENESHDPEMTDALATAVQGFMVGVTKTPPNVPAVLRKRVVLLADFVTRCRSGVVRDGYRHELEYAPEPEMPARLAKQLFGLLRGVAAVLGHQEATVEDMDRVARVSSVDGLYSSGTTSRLARDG